MRIFMLKVIFKVRWWYFHVNPNYIKFGMGCGSNEYHFQNLKTGGLHSNYVVTDSKTEDKV